MIWEPYTVTEDAALEDIVELVERSNVKRLPVMRGDKLVMVTTLQPASGRCGADARRAGSHSRRRSYLQPYHQLDRESRWTPIGHISGVITNEHSREATIVAAENVSGVTKVHDHLCWVELMSGMYLNSPEDDNRVKTH